MPAYIIVLTVAFLLVPRACAYEISVTDDPNRATGRAFLLRMSVAFGRQKKVRRKVSCHEGMLCFAGVPM